ncbi:acyl-[acyl carrier protein]--UDP-N-acetylglucosamine O-acyltransferase [Clostridium moniliforme]|uniref:Acyl-[acyl carrier protein]--UDP-N-acetylglucosamine O-acyltransferase n=1 Tax=Clostridium moniliforme TaxID=39489 RepID=A0ABS4EXF3_9CLOT|nr:hypothetical protein [Clostridium moniliforme]MBP1888679.1 acyl-[acyl carrier protein]--UDP-N-acetylglucosamine O-acyltransferase [Clostridium moniliforme]
MILRARTKTLEAKLKQEYKRLFHDEATIEEMEKAVIDHYSSEGKIIDDLYDFLEQNC